MWNKFLYLLLLLTGVRGLGQDNLLWYRQPAEKWTEALPIGNGRLGAMIFGGVGQEHLQWNESTLWSGRPRAYSRADAADYLGTIRNLLADGKQAEAEQLAEVHFMGLKDGDEKEYGLAKQAWCKKVRADTSLSGLSVDDRSWKEMTVPTPDGWEAAGLQGVDGAVWFRTAFDLPAGWEGKDVVLELGRIRDVDYTYVNGVRIGMGEGISKKRVYPIKASLLKRTGNLIAIQVINYDDKGGLTGLKGSERIMVRSESGAFALPVRWKYTIQDEEAPLLPKYEAEYLPFGDLYLKFGAPGGVSDYRRQLDISDAVATVSYVAAGVHYVREYFASEPQQVLVSHIRADKAGAIDVEASLTTLHRSFAVRRVDDHTLALSLKVRNGVLRGVSYLRVKATGGSVTVLGDKLVVRGADDVVFYLAASTSFRNYRDVSGDPEAKCAAVMAALQGLSLEKIRALHVEEYKSYFDKFSVRFGTGAALPTDERIVRFSPATDADLLALYMQYARYLLISSSRPSSPLPANLQGIWNDQLSPPWGSKYTTNINLEMNYWPAEALNLSECSQPLFRLIRDLSVAGRETASGNYKADGWVLHHNTDIWRGTAPINASNHGIWVTGGAWLCHQIWEHYCFTKDRAFLQAYYPVMREASAFFSEFLVEDGRTGRLISTPSNSPEHGGLVAGPAMDHQIIRDLFRNCIAASRVLGLSSGFGHELELKYRQIAPNQIGKYGQLQEWLEDKDDTTDTHRHISHLWGVYPGTDITWKDSALMRAARQSLLYRGDDGTGWSLSWKVNCWARFRDGDHALRLVDKLLSDAAGTQGGEKGGVYPNLLDAHPPFQIDGNFGGAAGIGELLLQSQDSSIDLLPALPFGLPDGEVKGICARGGFVLDFRWHKGGLEAVRVWSGAGGECVLRYKNRVRKVFTQKGRTYRFDGELENAQEGRRDVLLNAGWRTVVEEKDSGAHRGFEVVGFDDRLWKQVDVPHNWDAYGGYRRLKHGNLHGYAWYRKHFSGGQVAWDKRYFLWFEGVGSYARVWVNGKYVGFHAGGRTSFDLDITGALRSGDNIVAVRADHPAFIRDLPWVCGACSDDRGFSEGSQPLGIFRPVHLVMTGTTRIEPFGVHIWNDTMVSADRAKVFLETEIKNYGKRVSEGVVVQKLVDRNGTVVGESRVRQKVGAGETVVVRQQILVEHPRLWSAGDPYLYNLGTEFLGDLTTTPYGIRRIHWSGHQFLLNGKPVFINGIAEYEHKIGASHAFADEEIRSRVEQIRAAGFNAFRDAHQPHNLLYQHYWDSLGILWWPQLSAHVWYDSPAFRTNFKTLLTEWIKERRNSPSVILWGLQNESKLPEDFARECVELIRQLDPTAGDQRKVTTCNGGAGTDWDVPQNWTGTYGGDPASYGVDLKRQVLVGEYGAWRTLGLHAENVSYSSAAFTEDRMDRIMEEKIRLADSVKGEVAGHFAWLFSSHDNPGRVQSGEGWRELDRIGPVNYKGLLAAWGEPLDVFYLYRSNFVSAVTSPMVYIVSHTWPDRWAAPGKKDGIVVYSNCEEVELFNDIGGVSLGKRLKKGVGSHFQWDGVDIRYNVLYAVGYVGGKILAKDVVVLDHLPPAPHLGVLGGGNELVAGAAGYNYLYRVNCGGDDYADHNGQIWMADRHLSGEGFWGSQSWTDDYPGLPPYFASQRSTSEPIAGTADWSLFQSFRYGLDKLAYSFPVDSGRYRVELYFAEPWLGRGGGMDCRGWRRFDVAVNGVTVLKDLDIWKEAGYSKALKKIVEVDVTGGKLVISFPHVASGQAVLSALAIATTETGILPAPPSPGLIRGMKSRFWFDRRDAGMLPAELYGAEWIEGRRDSLVTFAVTADADVYDTTGMKGRRRFSAGATVTAVLPVFVQPSTRLEPAYDSKPVTSYKSVNARVSSDTTEWDMAVGVGDIYSLTVKYRYLPAGIGAGRLEVRMEDGTLVKEESVRLLTTRRDKWNYITTTTGTMINAGQYKVRFITARGEGFAVGELQVQ